MAENPFVYSRVLAPGDVVNREAEVDALLEDALGATTSGSSLPGGTARRA